MTTSSPKVPSAKRWFQAGGTLDEEWPGYVRRPADVALVDFLRAGDFCYVLAPRQMGKSSLRVRAEHALRETGSLCASIDLTTIGGPSLNVEQWYEGLTRELADKLRLPEESVERVWISHRQLSAVQRFNIFLREEVLGHITNPVVIFIDEIDFVLSLSFRSDEFFAAVRSIYNLRVEQSEYKRLTFCLLGVAAPIELVKHASITPFNIGRSITLEDFTLEEASVFLPGLAVLSSEPQRLLEAIFYWSSGHPYMTQRLCQALSESDTNGLPEDRVAKVVTQTFLQRGRVEDLSLSWIEQRFDAQGDIHKREILRLYRQLLQGEPVRALRDHHIQMELRLHGLAKARNDLGELRLIPHNRILATVFDLAWVNEKEHELSRARPLRLWLESGRSKLRLLKGAELEEALVWARAEHRQLSRDEVDFIWSSLEAARMDAEQDRRVTKEFYDFGQKERQEAIEQLHLAENILKENKREIIEFQNDWKGKEQTLLKEKEDIIAENQRYESQIKAFTSRIRILQSILWLLGGVSLLVWGSAISGVGNNLHLAGASIFPIAVSLVTLFQGVLVVWLWNRSRMLQEVIKSKEQHYQDSVKVLHEREKASLREFDTLRQEANNLRDEIQLRPSLRRYSYGIAAIGISGAGKTTLTLQWANPLFNGMTSGTQFNKYERTISRQFVSDSRAYVDHVFEFYDWGGEYLEEAYTALVKLQSFHCVILVVDLGLLETLSVERIQDQLDAFSSQALRFFFAASIVQHCKNFVLFINKIDLLKELGLEAEQQARASYRPLIEDLERYASRSGVNFRVIAGSASTGYNVPRLVSSVIESILPQEAFDEQLKQMDVGRALAERRLK